MEVISIEEVGLHSLTETHPRMTEEQFKAFMKDIEENGQLQPVVLYRNKIVDGRHRYLALLALGIVTIKVVRLANNLTLEEVKIIVNSTEMRRHQTPTQLAIKAYRLYKLGRLTQDQVVGMVGCSKSNLKHIITLEKEGRLDIVNMLEIGLKFDISTDPRFKKPTDSLLAIVSHLKEMKAKSEVEVNEIEGKGLVSQAEMKQLQAVELLVGSWTEPMMKMMIAKLYERLNNGRDV